MWGGRLEVIRRRSWRRDHSWVVVKVVVVIWSGDIVALFVHLVTLLMGRTGEFCWSGIAGRISLLKAGKGGSRSYGAQGARTSSGRLVMGWRWFLMEQHVREWVELLREGSCVFRIWRGQQVGEAAWSEWGLQQNNKLFGVGRQTGPYHNTGLHHVQA